MRTLLEEIDNLHTMCFVCIFYTVKNLGKGICFHFLTLGVESSPIFFTAREYVHHVFGNFYSFSNNVPCILAIFDKKESKFIL